METKSRSVLHGRSLVRLAGLVAFVVACAGSTPNSRADAAADLASFSVFDKIDLVQLAHGEVKSGHGEPMNNARFASVQSVYVVPGSPAAHAAAMDRWNPTSHAELKVFIHAEGSNFSRLSTPPDNAAVRSLVASTTKPSSDLQISQEEGKKLPVGATGAGAMPAPVANFWTGVLTARSRVGAAGQPSYDYSGQPIRPPEELRSLVAQQEKIRKRFAGIVGTALGGNGSKYWELLEVEDAGVLTLGSSSNKTAADGSIQVADALYYASGGYYVGLTLHQMWPVSVEGHPSTLVWRGDMISAPSLAGLHGIERTASESQMMKDISRAISLFRRDSGGGR